jgi:hypothetical protein
MPDGLKITPVVYAQTELPDSVHIVTRTQSEPSQEGTVRAVVAERVAAWTTDDPESTILAGRNGCLSIKVWEKSRQEQGQDQPVDSPAATS